MAIMRVEINDFHVFKGKFTAEFCPGVNVLIGSNGTGKTTLMRCMNNNIRTMIERDERARKYQAENTNTVVDNPDSISAIYIPEKDILEHAKGLLAFIEQKKTGFSKVYKSVLIHGIDTCTQEQSEIQRSVREKVAAIIGGEVWYDEISGTFYTLKADGSRVQFNYEASGYKRFGLLGLLARNGAFVPHSVLFWDEPENSLSPELIPKLVDILLELSRSGVQIFIATHSELLASYFAVKRKSKDEVMFASLYKEDGRININTDARFDWLTPNKLTEEPVKLYERKLDMRLGDE